MTSTDREAAKARVRAKNEALRQMPARDYIANLLHATRTHAEAEALLAEVVADAVEHERQQRQADHRTWQRDLAALRTAQDDNKRLRDENAALQQRLHDAATAKIWKNEDGKKFIFVEDIAPALFGIKRP